MSLQVEQEGADIVAKWTNYNLETGVPLASGIPMGGSPINPWGMRLFENDVEISASFEFDFFMNDVLWVRFNGLSYNPAAEYRVVSMAPVNTINSAEGLILPPFCVSTELQIA